MFTLALHCSHKLQPSDLKVFGPPKAYDNTADEKSWCANDDSRGCKVYRRRAHMRTATPTKALRDLEYFLTMPTSLKNYVS